MAGQLIYMTLVNNTYKLNKNKECNDLKAER